MKKVLIFIAGVVTGAALMIFILILITSGNSSISKVTLFEKEGECISKNSFEVFQVFDSGDALANEIEKGYSTSLPTGLVVLFLKESGKSFYDDQVIKVPSGKCAKQIGIFKYTTNTGMEKTVPIIDIRKK